MSGTLVEGPVWLWGCGNMAGAMLRRWLAAGLDPAQVTVIRRTGAAIADGVRVLTSPPADEPPPALLMLGVKPQMLDAVAPIVAPLVGPRTLLVSILAGVELASLRRRFAAPCAILRALPNTPVEIGAGIVALAGEGLDQRARQRAEMLMAPLGLVEWVDEAQFDVVTALAGSGGAFVYRFVDALAAAGADAGLAPERAAALALAGAAGATALAARSPESPRELAARIASPGGSTQKGLDVLDAPDGLVLLVGETLTAAILRNREMGQAAR